MAPLEREDELGRLASAVEDAVAGRGSVVVIEGAAGVGKSALLDEARRRAAGSLSMLGARGGLLEREFGFGVVRQLLEAALRGREVPEAVAAVLADPADAGPSPADAGFAALNGLFWSVLDLAAERPLLLAVDDLQWADRPSLRFLAYLARRLEGLPVVVVATVRTGEPDADEDLLDAVREAPAVILAPAPLGTGGVGALLAERLGTTPEPAFTTACHAATGGNPLLVRELASALLADGVRPVAAAAGTVAAVGPRAVSRTVGARLARLPADAREVARAVAVLGDEVSVADVATFAGLDPGRVAAATGPLARGEILRAEPPLAFVHPLVAEAVTLGLAPGERELQHARAARLLHDGGAPAEQVAGHLLRAPRGSGTWAVDVLRAAGRTALRRGAAESAGAFLRRALEEPPVDGLRAELLLETGLAEAMSDGPGAIEHLRGALASLVDPSLRALAAGALGRTLMFTRDAVGAAAVAREVADELPEELHDHRDQLLAFAHHVVWFDFAVADPVAGTAHLREHVPAEDDGLGTRMLAATAAYAWAHAPGPREACARLAAEALRDGSLTREDNGLLNTAPAVTLCLAEDPAGIVHLEAGLADAHDRGSLFSVAGLRLWTAAARFWRGELDEAEEHIRRAVDDLRVWGFDQGPDFATAFLVMTLVARGDLPAARTVFEASALSDRPAEGPRYQHEAHLDLLMAERRDTEAEEVVAVLADRYAHLRNPTTVTWRAARATLLARAGDVDGAARALAEQEALARAWGAPGPIGRVLRQRGELVGSEEDLRESVRHLEGSTMRLEHARALAALGRHLRLDRRPVDAREPLREALALAARCGADGLAVDVRSELGAAGARPRTDALRGPEALTPSERRVAALAAAGRTNRAIAQELFVTPKTVEVHLGASYRKLGIASRRELAGALAG